MYKVGTCLLPDLLKRRGMTQTELASRLNVTRQRVNALANNREKMSLETAYTIAKILQCEMEDLYTWEVSSE